MNPVAENLLKKVELPDVIKEILGDCRSLLLPETREEIFSLAMGNLPEGVFEVAYEVEGRRIREATVKKVRNGLAINYDDPYMRRRDPKCMVIADDKETDKETYENRFGEDFETVRQETFAWLKTQDLACFFFDAGMSGKGMPAVVICPANAAFFAFGLAELQGIVPIEEIQAVSKDYYHEAIIYIAPPFRHTRFEGKQVVVHNRRDTLHELFSYNLYPGP